MAVTINLNHASACSYSVTCCDVCKMRYFLLACILFNPPQQSPPPLSPVSPIVQVLCPHPSDQLIIRKKSPSMCQDLQLLRPQQILENSLFTSKYESVLSTFMDNVDGQNAIKMLQRTAMAIVNTVMFRIPRMAFYSRPVSSHNFFNKTKISGGRGVILLVRDQKDEGWGGGGAVESRLQK